MSSSNIPSDKTTQLKEKNIENKSIVNKDIDIKNNVENSNNLSKIICFIFKPIIKSKTTSTFTYGNLKIAGINLKNRDVNVSDILSCYHEFCSENEINNKLQDIKKKFDVKLLPNLEKDYTLITLDDTLYKIYTILVDINKIIQQKPNYNYFDMLFEFPIKYSFPNKIIEQSMIKSMFRQVAVIPIINDKIILYKSPNMYNQSNEEFNNEYRIINEFAKPHDTRTNENIAKDYFLKHYPNCKLFVPTGYFGFKLPKTPNGKDICCIAYLQFIPNETMLSNDHICIDIELFDYENNEKPQEKIFKKSFAIIRNNIEIIRNYINFQYADDEE